MCPATTCKFHKKIEILLLINRAKTNNTQKWITSLRWPRVIIYFIVVTVTWSRELNPVILFYVSENVDDFSRRLLSTSRCRITQEVYAKGKIMRAGLFCHRLHGICLIILMASSLKLLEKNQFVCFFPRQI